MVKFIRAAGYTVAVAAALCATSAAQASYFVRPVLQYNGSMVDGLSLNDKTSNSLTFNDSATEFQAHVNLADGTIKTFVQMTGPTTAFGIATGVMGDQIRYTGAEDVPVSFVFDFDSEIFADQVFSGTPPTSDPRYIGVQAHFAVYEAGSGAYWNDWTSFGTNSSKALYVNYEIQNFASEPGIFSLSYASSLGTDLYLKSGQTYDIFAAYNLILVPGAMVGPVTMNALNTSTIGISAPGGNLTSRSGQFLGLPQTQGAVPEPATWLMLLGGFAVAGAAMRRRSAALAVARPL